MTDETNKEQTAQEPMEPTDISASAVRQHDLFLKLTEQLKAKDEELRKLLDTKKQEAEARERQQLEAKGEYETITKKLQAEMDEQRAKYEQELINHKLEAALSRAGATNETFIRGAIASYDREKNIDEYVEALKSAEVNALMFGEPAGPAGQAPPGTARPGSRAAAKTNWAQVKEDLRNPETAVAADEKLREWFKNNDGYPPGWS